MKPYLTFFSLFLSAIIFGQNNMDLQQVKMDSARDESGNFSIYGIIRTQDSLVSKEKVFEVLKEAIYRNYGSGDAVIEYENKEEGKIYGRAHTSSLTYMNTFVKMNGGQFAYEITLLTKQGKAKIILSDIIHKKGEMVQMKDGSHFEDEFPSTWGKMGKKQSAKEWIKMKEQAYVQFKGIFFMLNDSLIKGTNKKINDF